MAVDLVLDLGGEAVGLACFSLHVVGGLVGELVGETGAEGNGVVLDALEILPAEDDLEGVVDVVSELLVAASHGEAAGNIATEPVETLAILGVVDELREALLQGLSVGLHGDTGVDLVVDGDVDLGLDGDLRLLVVVTGELHTKIICRGLESALISHFRRIRNFISRLPRLSRKRVTYVEGNLGATAVVVLDVEASAEFPLALSLLDLAVSADIDTEAVVIDSLALGIPGLLVVGEGVSGSAVAVVDLQLAAGLLDLRDDIAIDLLLNFLLHVEILQAKDRQTQWSTSTCSGLLERPHKLR